MLRICKKNKKLSNIYYKQSNKGDPKKTKELWEKGASLTYQEYSNNTAHHLAMLKNQKEIINYLLQSPRLIKRIVFPQRNSEKNQLLI